MNNPSDLYKYTTRSDINLEIMRAINEILFWERMEKLMPLVAKELVKAGVSFDEVKTCS